MTELHKFDSDVLVGHNISGFDLDVLLHRAQVEIYDTILLFLCDPFFFLISREPDSISVPII